MDHVGVWPLKLINRGSMESKVNYTIVGAFVIVLFSAIIFIILWLSSGFAFIQKKTYLVYMTESVSGLSVDSVVEYNGVNVGSVKQIVINHQNPRIVELLLSINNDTPITEGTRATLNTKGLTGVAYVALKDQGTERTPLRTLPNQPYPVIKTSPSLFMRLDIALSSITMNFQKVSQSIRALLDQQNLLTIKQTLLNIQQITGTLAAQSQKMTAVIENTAKASEQLTPLLRSSSSAVQLIQTQTLPAANEALINLNNMMSNLAEVSAIIKQNPAVMIRGKSPKSLGPGEQ